MTKEEVMNSIQLKKRFCKDRNLPISVYDNPYFMQRLTTIDTLFDCLRFFEQFCHELEQFSDEQSYFENYNKVKDNIINYIKDRPEFIAFNEEAFKTDTIYAKRNLYVEENDNKAFISIDMKKANFSSLNYYSSAIFDKCKTWEDFVGKFTTNKHIIDSKYIRQVVLGACNPKRQIQYEKFLMNKLLTYIVSIHPEFNIYSLGEDEILIEIENPAGLSYNELCKEILNCPEGIGYLVRVEMFHLNKIINVDGWIKYKYFCDKPEFKCLDAEIFHQIVKHFLAKDITEDDLIFYHNGKLAKFLSEVENPWD